MKHSYQSLNQIKLLIALIIQLLFTSFVFSNSISFNLHQTKNSIFKANADTTIIMETQPRFPGCESIADMKERTTCSQTKLFEFLAKNLVYPEDAKKNNIQGKVFCSFTVSKNGKILDVKILKSLSPTCDKEVLRIVELMNNMKEKWIPATAEGQAVDTEITLPVRFSF